MLFNLEKMCGNILLRHSSNFSDRHTLLGNELCRNRTGLRFLVRSFGCMFFYWKGQIIMVNGCRQKLKALTILLLSIALLFSMLGCSKKSDQVKLADTVEQIQGLEEYVPSGILAESFSNTILYEVTDISWSGETGTAKVKVITPDLARIISGSIEKAVVECGVEDYDALLSTVKEYVQGALNSDDCPMMDSVVEMEAKKTDEGFNLISNEEFERIISGNLEEIFVQTLREGLANENSN